MQRVRRMPTFKLSEIVDGAEGEVVHVDNVERFDQGIGQDAQHIGMAVAGTEEKVIRELAKSGSISIEQHPDIGAGK